MSYEILEHTADEKFRAKGETIEEAFSEATKAFSEIVKGENGRATYEISLESEKLETLLFDYLDKLIFLQDTEAVAVSHAEKIQINEKEIGYSLKAEIAADPITAGMNFTDIKAPTYNEMNATYEDGAWLLEAVLDI